MGAIVIKVLLEISELRLEIRRCPEKCLIEIFPSDRSDQPFDEWMRERHSRDSFDFDDLQDAEVRLPLVKLEQPVMI